ncbi:MAG TPA: ATP-grasp domain-containing protein, partial [Candidatus Polarisedimenticolaceae bacterium]|nr:ATP-grasp domain-containing protein [Candidatus Polarisedimenticolaceae bacterium]
MQEKNLIIAIDDVEPGLVAATKKLSKTLGRELRGLVVADLNYPSIRERSQDTSGLFEEIICDLDDHDSLQKALKPHMDSLLAVSIRNESSVPALRKLVPFLPYVPTPSESSLLWSTEKHLMRDRLRSYDSSLVPQYCYLTESNPAIIKDIVRKQSFPMIVKPNGLACSLLVVRCNNEAELTRCLNQTFQVINDIYSRDLGRGTPSVLVEEMIQGDMYSTDAYVNADGKVYCLPLVKVITAESLGLPGFYSYRHIIPTGLPKAEIEAAQAASVSAIRALNLSSTTAHIELFHSPEGWKIIELGPRIGGYREGLYRESYGIDHYYNDLAVKVGLEPDIPEEPIGHA